MYNAGFAIFTIFSVLLTATWLTGTPGVLWLIVMADLSGRRGRPADGQLERDHHRRVPDRPARPGPEAQYGRGHRRGLPEVCHRGILAPINWHWCPGVSPVSLFGTVWAYLKLHDTEVRHHGRIDWWENLTSGCRP